MKYYNVHQLANKLKLEEFIRLELRKRKMRGVNLIIESFELKCFSNTALGDVCLDSKWLEDIHIEFLKILVSHELDHIQLYRMLYWKSKKLCEKFQKALDEELEEAFLKTFGRDKV